MFNHHFMPLATLGPTGGDQFYLNRCPPRRSPRLVALKP